MTMRYLITGGAGFIGINAADYYLRAGNRVTLLDNFSRAGTEDNLGLAAGPSTVRPSR